MNSSWLAVLRRDRRSGFEAVNKDVGTTECVLTAVAWTLKWRASISSALPVPTVLFGGT
jgi:hypothetical protein